MDRRILFVGGVLFACLAHASGAGPAARADGPAPVYVVDGQGQRPAPVVAVEQVCAWPNLTMLPDGTVVALIYNQPSHGQLPGDVECWASEDEGRTWRRRGVAAPRGGETENRMNVAAGLTADGDLILVSSGWSAPGDPAAEGRANYGSILPAWVCRSADGGFTWTIDRERFPPGPTGQPLVPFGDIMPGADGKLRVSAYLPFNYVVRGDGETWDAPVRVGRETRFNETAVLHLGDGRWLAAARCGSRGLTVLASDDDAATWQERETVTGNLMHPGHLLRLADGAILLSYGNRNRPMGVEVLFSGDEGRTWTGPFRVLDTGPGDMGYPSSVQLADGRVLTAYYARSIAGYSGYHMGVVAWDPAETRARVGTKGDENRCRLLLRVTSFRTFQASLRGALFATRQPCLLATPCDGNQRDCFGAHYANASQ